MKILEGTSHAPFDKKIALVTGASRGIGFEVVRELATRGVHVLLSGRSRTDVHASAKLLASLGLSVEALTLDVTSCDDVVSAEKYVAKKYGRLDILVNNAAIRIEQYGLQPSQQPIEKWRETFETNLFGIVRVTQAFLPLLLESKSGRIVNVSSLLASISTHSDKASYAYSGTFKSLPAYSASKSSVNSWTVHLAYELRDTSIKVNAVHPGYTKTGMNDGAGDLTVQEGAKTTVAMALLDEDGKSGQYVHMDSVIPW